MPQDSPTRRPKSDTKVVDYHDYVDQQVRRTSQAVRAADICQAVLRLIMLVMILLAVAALAEHWVVRGGFSGAIRYSFFGGLLVAVGWWAWRELWPLVSRPINPVFAAQTIEQASPSLKNSLVNLLLFRGRKAQMPAAVYEALERQAAEGLVGAAGDEPVDRGGMIRLGYALVGLLVLGAAYTIFSPKNPLLTAARVLMPWSEIAAPTRVQITDVEPGTSEATRGAVVPVSARVTGLADDEQPELVLLTGKRGEGVRVPLTTDEAGASFATDWLPPADADASRPVRWRIEAGDARSPVYRLTLRTAPAIVVRQVEYDYPDYTGYLDRTVEGIGDLRAIEGTRVTVSAEANTPITTAQVDLNGDGRPDIQMDSDGATANAAWTLALRDDRRGPRHASYVLRYTTPDDRTNEEPASYRIEVTPDVMPEASVVEPEEPTRDVRLNEAVTVRVEARDPDFGLKQVRVRGESLGDEVFDASILDEKHEGRFEGRWRFRPTDHGLRVGDVVEYWVTAVDVKAPGPHRVDSPRQRFRIIDADPGQPDELNQLAERPNEGGQGEKGEGGEGQQGEGQQGGGQQGEGQQGEGQEGEGESGEGQMGQGQDGAGQQGEGQQGEGQQGGGGQQGGQQQEGQQEGSGQQDGAGGQQEGQQEGQQQGGQSSDGGSEGGQSEGQQDGGQAGEDSGNPQGGQGGNQSDQPNAGARGGDSSANSEGGAGDSEAPVSSEGDDDATAFDRIRDHFEKQGESDGGQQDGNKQPGDSSSNSDGSSNSQQGGDRNAESGDNPSPEAADPSDGSKPSAGEQPERNGGQDAGGDPDNAERSRQPSDSTSSQSGGNVSDERTAEDNEAQDMDRPREGTGNQGKSEAADEGTGAAGDRGTGESTNEGGQKEAAGDQQGDPSQGDQPGEGQSRREGQGDKPGGEPSKQSSDGNSDGQSNGQSDGNDSQSGQQDEGNSGEGGNERQMADPKAGDRGEQSGDSSDSDGGEQQQSQNEDSRGESGEGEDQSAGDEQAGEPSSEQGDGQSGESRQPSSDNSDQQSRQPQDDGQAQDGGQPGEQDGQPSDRTPGQPGGSEATGPPQGGTGGGNGDGQRGEPGGDEANLDFARKKTDLLLENLADQLKQKKVDQDLLDRLGWTEQDLRRFVARWQSRKQAAQQRGGAANEELDEALRSLGWKPGGMGAAQAAQRDAQRDNRSGFRGAIPAKYRDRLRRYNDGVSRGE